MTRATLIALSLLLSVGCAREAAPVNTAASNVSPYAHLESAVLWRDCDGFCGAPAGCIAAGDEAFYRTGGNDKAYERAVAGCIEERCMLVAERAYEAAAGRAMSSLGDAPVPDAAYEDAYARCTEGR